MRSVRAVFMVGLAASLVSPVARADAIDLVPYFTRVPGGHSRPVVVGLVVVLMLVNYGLNVLVVGLPAFKASPASARTILLGLAWMTLWGQLADRAGAFLALLSADGLAGLLRVDGEGAWFVPVLGMNFLFSGLAVGVLALYFLRRRWQVARRTAWLTALAAGIITNPAWAIGPWFS
jgi:hypothetical protein